MRVCSFCGENNEDWMNICQRCGNSIVNADLKENEKKIEPYEVNEVKYSSKKQNKTEKKFIDDEEEKEPKEKRIIENLDLKIILAILLVILFILIVYTIATF